MSVRKLNAQEAGPSKMNSDGDRIWHILSVKIAFEFPQHLENLYGRFAAIHRRKRRRPLRP